MNSCTKRLKIGRQYSDNGAYTTTTIAKRRCAVPISDIEKISTMSRHEKMCPAFPAFETISAFSRVLVEMAKKTLAETAAKEAEELEEKRERERRKSAPKGLPSSSSVEST